MRQSSEAKGQVSMEYLVVVGFVIAILIPSSYIFYTFSQDFRDEVASSQLRKVAQEVTEAAESVYYQGPPSKQSLRVSIPHQVSNDIVNGREVGFGIRTQGGKQSDIVVVSAVNVTGALPDEQGVYTVVVTAKGGEVEVTYS